MKLKVCERLCHGARTVEHSIEDIVAVRATQYYDPIEDSDLIFIGFDYPIIKNRGLLVIHFKNGKTEVYPASNWQVEF